MPECKNDHNRSYKGTEPSPKGLGYCAHSENIGKERKGKDGNKWIVSETKSGIKRWIKLKENKKISRKYYFIHENGARPFVVFINKNKVEVYKKSKEINDEKLDVNSYDKLVKSFNVSKIFIGKSPKIEMTEYSGGYGKKYDGNTILLHLKQNNYVLIDGYGIENFKLKNDKIIKYYSPLGNNNVPYPFALGEKNYYFFIYPDGYLSKSLFPKIKKESDLQNIIDFGIETNPFMYNLKTHKLKNKMTYDEFKIIQNKNLDDISLNTIQKLAKMFSVYYIGKSKKEIADIIYKLRGVKVYKNI
jgi:hypothetical protein